MGIAVNEVDQIKWDGKWYRVYKIHELFCYRHPKYGHIVKKSYADKMFMTTGRLPAGKEACERLIEVQKRKIVRYNTQVTAPGDKPITDWWWEPPGEPGRFDDKGNRL